MLFGSIGVDECLLFTTPISKFATKVWREKVCAAINRPDSSDTVSEERASPERGLLPSKLSLEIRYSKSK
ncbi:Uncharacterised protein [Vibrio cholerae]|nr:Uncharacterised protein [Vibrio cholerae]CSD37853.1 Uncharacterised protein [Vibrio cholerae]